MDKKPNSSREDDGDWSADFQKKRRGAWRRTRWAVLVLLVSFAGIWWDMRLFIPGFIASIIAIFWILRVTTRRYLCPACGKIPMTNGPAFGTDGIFYNKDVALDPEFCSNCGVRLKAPPEVTRLLS
jgi:ribosomal protein S27AE